MNKDEYSEAIEMLSRGNLDELRTMCSLISGFPFGKDELVNRHWITNAIDCGSLDTIEWMINKGVNLKFRDDEGYTPLHSCLGRDLPHKYKVLGLLISNGADLNAHGVNDYTPLHLAAVRNDQKAIQMLLQAGADLSIRTRIDDYSTAEEKARRLGHSESANFLANFR